MEAHIVEQAPMAPGQCLFSQDIDGPWIDTGVMAPWVSPYGYISVNYVEGLARDLLEMIPRYEVDAKVKELENRLAKYAAKVEQLSAFVDAHERAEELREGAGI